MTHLLQPTSRSIPALEDHLAARLLALLAALIDQTQARVLVPPLAAQPGFWFGGGNLAAGGQGVIWLTGRYRNAGDSRTGLEAGTRGLECTLFRSTDGGATFQKVAGWSKADLSQPGRAVISLEGTALYRRPDGRWEYYISAERAEAYPAPWDAYQKPGTGVWSIDCMAAATPDALDPAALAPVLHGRDHPEVLHVKDPVVFDAPTGETALIFCSHPFTWASSNSGLALRPAAAATFTVATWELAPRGAAWDVAATRITARLPVPRLGLFADLPPASIYFYDGAECLRAHDEHGQARRRPRGYSCEEIGGAFLGWDAGFPRLARLSVLQPLFVSPWGTGVSRYVDVLATGDTLFATWQQGQADGSQPLVGHHLPLADVARLLA
jgi:hypothetical protein